MKDMQQENPIERYTRQAESKLVAAESALVHGSSDTVKYLKDAATMIHTISDLARISAYVEGPSEYSKRAEELASASAELIDKLSESSDQAEIQKCSSSSSRS